MDSPCMAVGLTPPCGGSEGRAEVVHRPSYSPPATGSEFFEIQSRARDGRGVLRGVVPGSA